MLHLCFSGKITPKHRTKDSQDQAQQSSFAQEWEVANRLLNDMAPRQGGDVASRPNDNVASQSHGDEEPWGQAKTE